MCFRVQSRTGPLMLFPLFLHSNRYVIDWQKILDLILPCSLLLKPRIPCCIIEARLWFRTGQPNEENTIASLQHYWYSVGIHHCPIRPSYRLDGNGGSKKEMKRSSQQSDIWSIYGARQIRDLILMVLCVFVLPPPGLLVELKYILSFSKFLHVPAKCKLAFNSTNQNFSVKVNIFSTALAPFRVLRMRRPSILLHCVR